MPDQQVEGSLIAGGRYRVLRTVQAGHGDARLELGTRHMCRFCGRTGQKNFRTVAHTFPEALGNKWVVSLDECDVCNQLFSVYEDALANAVSPLLTVGGTEGKDGTVRGLGRSAGNTIARHTGNDEGRRQLTFIARNVGKLPDHSINGPQLDLQLPLPPVPFRPRHAYKALSKIGLALVPDDLLAQYSQLLKWLQNTNDDVDFPVLEVGLSFGSIGNAPPVVSGVLLQRVDDRDPIPFLHLLFCAGSVCAQLSLKSDHLEDHLPPTPIGSVAISWSVVLGGHNGTESIRLHYGDVYPFNWASPETQPQPIESFQLNFDTETTQGRLIPVLRKDIDGWF